jgi:hypothetical protein
MHLLAWFTALAPEALPALLALLGVALARVSPRMNQPRSSGRS